MASAIEVRRGLSLACYIVLYNSTYEHMVSATQLISLEHRNSEYYEHEYYQKLILKPSEAKVIDPVRHLHWIEDYLHQKHNQTNGYNHPPIYCVCVCVCVVYVYMCSVTSLLLADGGP